MSDGMQIGGYIAFTLENVNPENEESLSVTKPDWKWQLSASGRFVHRKEYVLSVAKEYSFDLVYYDTLEGFRFENGIPVRGHLFIMQKLSSNEEL
mmetsp:Transcript_40932/g.96050  ORF Transcript_40932/g.96050 Transcript_40932/m.96050 type:complete len:95 (+) Transcript_40932:1496-1780(+)